MQCEPLVNKVSPLDFENLVLIFLGEAQSSHSKGKCPWGTAAGLQTPLLLTLNDTIRLYGDLSVRVGFLDRNRIMVE
jgi:hypothetical protein